MTVKKTPAETPVDISDADLDHVKGAKGHQQWPDVSSISLGVSKPTSAARIPMSFTPIEPVYKPHDASGDS